VRRGIWIALLAAVVFAAILLARLRRLDHPGERHARLLLRWRLMARCCSGVCTGLTVQRTAVGDVSWELHPWLLFFGKLAAHIAARAADGKPEPRCSWASGTG